MPIFTKYESVLLDQQDVYDVLRKILKNIQAKKKTKRGENQTKSISPREE